MGCGAAEEIEEVVGDVAAAATGNAEFIPLINAGVTGANDIASGQSVGKSLEGAALSGGEALAGQEVAGAVGLGQGNTAFNNAFGITGDTPAGTGLPDIGGAANSALGGVENFLGVGDTAPAAGAISPTDLTAGEPAATTPGGSPTAATPSTATPTGGAIVGAGQAAGTADQAIGAITSPGAIAGTSTSATPGLGSLNASGSDAFNGTPAGNAGAITGTDLTAGEPAATGVNAATDNLVNSFSSSQAAPTTPAAGGAGGGILGTGISGKSLAGAALPLGYAAYNAIKGSAPLPSEDQPLELSGAVTGPLATTEANSLNAYNSGTLTAPQQAQVLQYVQGQQNALIQQLASEGVTDFKNDSRYIQGMSTIQQNATAMQEQFLQASLTAGLSAAGGAAQNLSQVAQQQLSDDASFQTSLQNAFGAIGGIIGGTPNIRIGATA